MEKQKEALLRIVDQLKCKSEEAGTCHDDLVADLQTLNDAYESSQEDLNTEFNKLVEALAKRKEVMSQEIAKKLENKKETIKAQLKLYEDSRSDANELIRLSNKALELDNANEFSKTALSIKERITMSSLFRLSMTPSVVDPACHLVADFTREEKLLESLSFLPVPSTPVIDDEHCSVVDNNITCQWEMPPSVETCDDLDMGATAPTELFLLQYRQVVNDQGNQDVPWVTVENLKEMSYKINDLVFTKPMLQVRVQAWNKSVGGNFSSISIIPTPAFNFVLDKDACHGNLKISNPHCVEWDPASVKGVETRVKSAGNNRPTSPLKTASPKKIKSKDRFTGESYTVLGDAAVPESDIYFEVTPQDDSKTYSIGVTAQSLSRYDQLGRTPLSWCITVNSWIQKTFVAKHNNKMKNLDNIKVPKRFGIYLSPKLNYLAFYNPDTHDCIYSFKQVKSSNPLVPGFSVWCGSLQLYTGIQVPSWVETKPNLSPKARSMSVVSSEASKDEA